MQPELIERLRDDLLTAGFDANGIRLALGTDADAARQRGVLAPARRSLAARGSDSLSQLISLFLLGDPLDEAALAAALPTLGSEGAATLGLIVREAGAARAALSLNAVEVADPREAEPIHWWIISDLDDHLRGRPARPDHVMGVGGATRSLIAQLPTGEAGAALDLGTGCGIVAMHLALRGQVVATDISERALALAEANARLNRVTGVSFRQGDLFAPVTGERFDLIVSNPPFVVTPRATTDPNAPRYVYRDGELVGDAIAERVTTEGPTHLADEGTLLLLANWECPWGVDGLDRVREWIAAAARPLCSEATLAAWVIERDRVSATAYAETWARDGGARPGNADFEGLIEAWLDDFAARRVVALGLGSIRIRRLAGSGGHAEGVAAGTEAPDAFVHCERAGGAFSEAAGRYLESTFSTAIRVASMSDSDVLARHWWRAENLIEVREHVPGEESPRAITLQSEAGIARRVTADPLLAAAVGACDGDLTLRQIADALATLLDVDEGAAREALVAGARELARIGMLTLEPAPR